MLWRWRWRCFHFNSFQFGFASFPPAKAIQNLKWLAPPMARKADQNKSVGRPRQWLGVSWHAWKVVPARLQT